MSTTDHKLKFAYVGLGEMGSAMVSAFLFPKSVVLPIVVGQTAY